MTLTSKQRCFVDEYLVDLNATQAAVRAGYSGDTARQLGYQNLSKPAVAEAIAAAQAARAARTQIGQDWVIERLRLISDRCMQLSPVLDRKGNPLLIENAQGAIVPAFTFDAAGANRATELLGKHLGMFNDRVDHTGKIGLSLEALVLGSYKVRLPGEEPATLTVEVSATDAEETSCTTHDERDRT